MSTFNENKTKLFSVPENSSGIDLYEIFLSILKVYILNYNIKHFFHHRIAMSFKLTFKYSGVRWSPALKWVGFRFNSRPRAFAVIKIDRHGADRGE